MTENNIANCWHSPDGVSYPLSGKSHSEFAYDILLNEKIGEHMSKQMPTDGSSEMKGKSGEVAKADAERELGGNPMDPKHSAELCERGWVQASDKSGFLVIRSTTLERIGELWEKILPTAIHRSSVVFAIGHQGSGVSAGLCGHDLHEPKESVIYRIADIISGKLRDRSSLRWSSQGHGIRYFE